MSDKKVKTLPRLGRGLEAVFGKSFVGSGRSVVEVPIKDIVVNQYQPRRHFNEEGMKKLINSIKQNGLAQPILIRPSELSGYELIAGERRLRACIEVGLTMIPSIIKSIGNLESLQLALVENLDREDLNAIEEAEGYSRLIHEFSYTHKMLAEFFGKSRSAISNSLRLLNLSETVKSSLLKNEITEGHARALLGLTNSADQESFLEKILELSLSVRQLEKMVGLRNNELEGGKNLKDVKQDLGFFHEDKFYNLLKRYENYGFKVSHAGTDQKGKITLAYSSKEEYERLVRLLA